jgi:hypothetical protein
MNNQLENNIRKILPHIDKLIHNIKRKYEPVSESSWYFKAKIACQDVSDALLRQEKGLSSKIVKGVAGKLGAAGASVGIFSIASLLGSASTGTAIGSLSGAAFTSAALAWIGGSVFVGSIILSAATLVGGLGAVIGVSWLSKSYLYGKKRKKSELEQKEQSIVDTCLALAMAFHQQEQSGEPPIPIVAKAIYEDALKPLCDELLALQQTLNHWPYMAKKRLKNAITKLEKITSALKQWSEKYPNVSVGIVSSVFIQLLSEQLSIFDEHEELVLTALRRSSPSLKEATNEQLAEYVKSFTPAQLVGLQNNIKGIYHELRFEKEENTDGDEYIVELFEATNHPGADVKITNTLTGEVKEVQLKATDYLSYIKQHNQRYENISVFATEEVAIQDIDITSTGITNEELKEDVTKVISELGDEGELEVASSMTTAAMISLAKNVKILLHQDQMTAAEKIKLVEGGAVAAGVAGIISLLTG